MENIRKELFLGQLQDRSSSAPSPSSSLAPDVNCERTGCDRRRRFVWNLPQFREKGIKHVCVSVSRDNGGGPPAFSSPPTGYTTGSGLSSVLHNVPPSVREQRRGDNREMISEMFFFMIWIWGGKKTYIKMLSKAVVWHPLLNHYYVMLVIFILYQ